MIHRRFSLDEICRTVPAASCADEDGKIRRFFGNVTGPGDLTLVQHHREHTPTPLRDLPSVPADIFVWSLDVSGHPAATRIGGTPHLPRSEPWPADSLNRPLNFVAQICFADSRDLAPSIPGDVLLIFAEHGDFGDFPFDVLNDDALRFIWARLDDSETWQRNLSPRRFGPFTGHPVRIDEYPAILQDDGDWSESGPSSGWVYLSVLNATKIGGAPAEIQGEMDLPSGHLCTLSSISPMCGYPYAFVDHHEPYPIGKVPEGEFMIGDVGVVTIAIDQVGDLHWSVDCY